MLVVLVGSVESWKRQANEHPSGSMGCLSLKCAAVVLCSLLVNIRALPVQHSPEPYPPVKCQRATARTLQSFPIPFQKLLTQTWSRTAGIDTENARFVVAGNDLDWLLKDIEEREELKVCPGVGEWTADLPRSAVVRVPLHAVIAEAGEKTWDSHTLLLMMLAPEDLGGQVQSYHGNLSVTCSCDGTNTLCWDITIETKQKVVEPLYLPDTLRLSRRNAIGTSHSAMQQRQSRGGTSTPIVVVLVVAVVGVVALVAVLALCAGGSANTYEPQLQAGKVVPLKDPREIVKPETVTVTVQMDSQNNFVRNGALAPKQIVDGQHEANSAEGQTSLSGETDATDSSSRDRGMSPESEQSAGSKVRSLSARSQDPLPEIPALDTAEETKQEERKEADSSDKENGGDDDDDDPYSYARFPKGGDKMEGSESEEEGKGGENPQAANSKPPYGKVTRHPSHGESERSLPETESYAEVREVFRGPLSVKARMRSATDPLEPTTVPADVRSMRAYTESAAHLPLPDIPNMPAEGESTVYDSIPEDVNSKVKPKPNKQRKERLYESVDDMGGPEDTYETVPDDIKPHTSPTTPIVLVPVPLPPRSPSISKTNVAPCPQVPASPIPNKKGKEKELKEKEMKEKKVEKRELTKTVSEADSKKRSFSFFGARKKTSSVSAGVGKTRRERDQQEPLPDVPSPISPLHLSPPPPPNIPAPLPPDVDEDRYDQPQLDVGRTKSESPVKKVSFEHAKVKSQSLPSSMRSAGANVFNPRANLPLPELPEDSSGSGTVTVVRKRKESFDEDYDIVLLNSGNENEDDEPGYDTVNREEILGGLAENPEGIDPGYDRVGKNANEEEEVLQEQDEDEDAAAVGPTDMRYAKVTKPSSPVEDKGVPPDHDEEGYAVVPEEIKLRKRAMSASKGIQRKLLNPVDTEPGYDSVKQSDTDPSDQQLDEPGYKSVKTSEEEEQPPSERGTSPASPQAMSPDVDDQYATVDIAAKRASQRHRKENYHVEIDVKESASSPDPPPLPPIVDLGDMEDEFQEPPIPAQSEGVHQLVETEHGYSRILKPTDHPYSQLDVLSDPLDVLSDPPYARVLKQRKDIDHVDDDAVGYDTVGDRASNELAKNEALGYDTVGDQLPEVEADCARLTTKSKIEQDMPTLEPADRAPVHEEMDLPPQNIYDSLMPVHGQENGVEEKC